MSVMESPYQSSQIHVRKAKGLVNEIIGELNLARGNLPVRTGTPEHD